MWSKEQGSKRATTATPSPSWREFAQNKMARRAMQKVTRLMTVQRSTSQIDVPPVLRQRKFPTLAHVAVFAGALCLAAVLALDTREKVESSLLQRAPVWVRQQV